ncbi:hypothetical protein [Herbaspirillum sp. YR522]|uniref:hypothetical protein n=1 Tax=Herbaspirillum sp. YR522 TaxID=1144342 RepID=UPI0012F79882|nr:hypothetical protein [Herbaspirillum sp. YR522]
MLDISCTAIDGDGREHQSFYSHSDVHQVFNYLFKHYMRFTREAIAMAEVRKRWEWFAFYLMASFLALLAAIFSMDFFWPNYDAREQASGSVEQQFYLLLVDRGYWLNGISRDAEFSEGMTEEGRKRFFLLLKEIRFREHCLIAERTRVTPEMACVVNGNDIDVVPHN